MAHPRGTRDKLRRLYVHDQISLEVAAPQCGVAFSTASRWKRDALAKGDDWDKHRAATLMAGGGIEEVARAALNGFMVQYQSTMALLNTDSDIPPDKRVQMLASVADSFNKTISASKRVLPETSQLATAMEVLQAQARFVREHYPQHAQAFAEILEPFGDELTGMYG